MPSQRGTGAQANVQQFEAKQHGGHIRTRPFFYDDFDRSTLGLPLVLRDTSAAGSPTFAQRADIANGVFRATLDATNEVQLVGADWADQRMIPANRAWEFEAFVALPATLATNEAFFVGVGSDYNSNPDSITISAFWRVTGGSSGLTLIAEADDNVTDRSTTSSRTLTAGTMALLRICSKPNGNVEFWVNDDRQVVHAMAFDSTALQPLFYLRKASGTTTPTADVDFIYCDWDRF
jgi:hypothetical protein